MSDERSVSAREPHRRRRVLVVLNKPTRPATSGHRVRLNHLLDELSMHADLTAVVVTKRGDIPSGDRDENLNRPEIVIHTALNVPSARFLRDLRRGLTTTDLVLRRPRDWSEFTEEHGPFDAAFASGPLVAEATAAIHEHLPLMLDLPHIEREIIGVEETLLETSERGGRLALLANAAQRYRRAKLAVNRRGRLHIERKWVDRAAVVTCTTAEHVRELSHGNVALVPNGVSLPSRGSRRTEPARGQRVLLLGNQSYAPNADAVLWACREIVPRLRQALPTVDVVLVGNTPDAIRKRAEDAGVRVLGFVTDLGSVIESCAVMLAPLRVGSGTKTKVLEAMSFGLPVVTTSCGIEGLQVEPGRDVLVAESADELAGKALSVLQDDALARRLGAAAQGVVRELYDWNKICRDAYLSAWAPVLDADHGEVVDG